MIARGARGPGRPWHGLRVLVVSAAATHPADRADRRRINALCHRLRDHGAEIHLLHYPAEPDWAEPVTLAAQRRMAETWDSYLIAPVTRPLFAPAAGDEHTIDEWWDPAIEQMLAWLFRAHAFDAVLVTHLWLSRALTLAPEGVARIFDTFDRVWQRDTAAFDGDTTEVFRPGEAEERIGLARAEIVWAIAAPDAALFVELCDGRVLTVPHVEPAPKPLPRAHGDVLRFGVRCEGGAEAPGHLRRFLAAAEAYVRRTLLPCEFLLAGANPGLAGENLPPFARLVDDGGGVAAFLDGVDVLVGVADLGSDFAGGIADALARGKAVIAEADAFAGLVPSHRLHGLASAEEVMRACGEVARVPRLIDDLEAASFESLARAARAADAAIEASVPGRRALPRGVVFVVAAGDVVAGSLVLDHVCEAARFAGHQTETAVFIDGVGATERPALARLRALGPVLLSPEAAAGATPTAGQRVVTLEEVLRSAPLALWFACIPKSLPERLRPAATTALLPFAILGMGAPEAALPAFARRLKRMVARVVATDSAATSALGLAARHGIETHLVPAFWQGFFSERLQTARTRARSAVTLFAAAPDSPALALARDVARVATRRPVEIVAGDGLAAWLRRGGDVPWLAVEIGHSPAFAALLELFDRAGIPRLALFCPAAAPPPPAGRSAGRAVGLMESALLLADVLQNEDRADALAAAGVARHPAQDDGGWTLIWDLIHDLKQREAESEATRPGWTAEGGAGRDLRAELVLHIQDRGTYRYPMRGWIGVPGDKRPIEAFAVRPLESLVPGDIEYRAVGRQGQETPWVSDAKLCGTRDRGVPLTGFAIRLAPHLRAQFEVVYEGVFLDGRVAGPKRNGELCLPATNDSPLEAMRVRLLERLHG